MYVCMYVCVYVCVYVRTYVSTYVRTCVCVYVLVWKYRDQRCIPNYARLCSLSIDIICTVEFLYKDISVMCGKAKFVQRRERCYLRSCYSGK